MRVHLTIGRKLAISFGVVFILLCVLSYSSLDAIRRIGAGLDTAVNENTRAAHLVGDIASDLQQMKRESWSAQFADAIGSVLKVDSHKAGAADLGECSNCHTFGAAEQRWNDFETIAARARAHATELDALVHTGNARKALDAIRGELDEWSKRYGEYVALASQSKFSTAHAVITDRMDPLLEGMNQAVGALTSAEDIDLAAVRAEAHSTVSRSRWTTLLLIALSIVCAAGVVANIRRMTRVLRATVCELEERCGKSGVSATQVLSAGQSLAGGASDQAASLQETSSSAEEVSATAHKNTEFSDRMAAVVEEVRREVERTNTALGQTIAAMTEIDASSLSISKIIKTINEIAFQTNLLALNAAVEAARAGDAGLGFAVVAEEVRNLARRCAEAARDTENLIGESIAKAHEGKNRLHDLAASIQSITGATSTVSTLADQVRTGSREQSRAMEEIERALIRISEVTQKGAAAAQQSATAGDRLKIESNATHEVVERLSTLVE